MSFALAVEGMMRAKARIEQEWFFGVMRRHGLSFVRDDGRLSIGHAPGDVRFFLLDGEPISKLTIETRTPSFDTNSMRWSEPDYTITYVGTESMP